MDGADSRRSGRVLRVAVVASLLVHAAGFFLWGLASSTAAALAPRAISTQRPDMIVTLSRSTTIRKRTQPQAVRRSRPRTATSSVPWQLERTVAAFAPSAPPATAPVRDKRRMLHELARSVPPARAQAPRTVRATAPPERLSEAQPAPAKAPPARSARGQLDQRQLARINADIQSTLSQLRAEDNPLAVRATASPGAQRPYRVQMLSAAGGLPHAQGSCYPIKSWAEGGYDYYYETCDVQFEDGHVEVQPVPWPIRYKAGRDLYHGDLGTQTVPLPPPLPGYKLPAGEHVSDELRAYAHEHGVDI